MRMALRQRMAIRASACVQMCCVGSKSNSGAELSCALSTNISLNKVHRGPESEKIVLREPFNSDQGITRCRQTVPQTCSVLHRSKAEKLWPHSMGAASRRMPEGCYLAPPIVRSD